MTDTKIESAYQELKEAKIEIRNRYGKLQEKLQADIREVLENLGIHSIGGWPVCPTHSRVSNVWDQESVELLALPLIPRAGMTGGTRMFIDFRLGLRLHARNSR